MTTSTATKATIVATAMTAQQLHAAILAKEIPVSEAIIVLKSRMARCEAEGRKPRAPSVQLLKELEALKPKASVAALVNPVDALKAQRDAKLAEKGKAPAKPKATPAAKPAAAKEPAKPAAKAAEKTPTTLTDAQLLDLVRERASADASFRSQVGKLFIELANA